MSDESFYCDPIQFARVPSPFPDRLDNRLVYSPGYFTIDSRTLAAFNKLNFPDCPIGQYLDFQKNRLAIKLLAVNQSLTGIRRWLVNVTLHLPGFGANSASTAPL